MYMLKVLVHIHNKLHSSCRMWRSSERCDLDGKIRLCLHQFISLFLSLCLQLYIQYLICMLGSQVEHLTMQLCLLWQIMIYYCEEKSNAWISHWRHAGALTQRLFSIFPGAMGIFFKSQQKWHKSIKAIVYRQFLQRATTQHC